MALDQLSKEGYQFVTVSDLLKYKGHSEYKQYSLGYTIFVSRETYFLSMKLIDINLRV